MNNTVQPPVGEDRNTSSVRRGFLSRRVCLAVILAAVPILLWLEVGKPTFTEDPVLAPLVSMTNVCHIAVS